MKIFPVQRILAWGTLSVLPVMLPMELAGTAAWAQTTTQTAEQTTGQVTDPADAKAAKGGNASLTAEEEVEDAPPSRWRGATYDRLLEQLNKTFGEPRGMVRLDPESRVWADKAKRRVAVDGFIALKEGQLEMLACIAGTKEHESVVAVFSQAKFVHAGLLAVGAQKGHPVRWEPTYAPPTGSEVKVTALWVDSAGKKHAIDAREWVREAGTVDKTLDTNFVFAGSSLWTDPETGEQLYQAESGDLICVANFSTATLDVPLKSLKSNSLLTFIAFSERIPDPGTPVRLVLEVLDAEGADGAETNADATNDTGNPAPGTTDGAQNSSLPAALAGYERLLESPAEARQASLKSEK
ncbi:YdjY domain-containing protein [Aureliella helgolandensis]|nr:YdjY domain-containing protein [Aureliella helgolandensis]